MTPPISVLHVLETDGFAGTETHVLALIAAQAPTVRASLLCRPGSPLHARAQDAGIPCLAIPNARTLARHLRREGHHIVHAHDGAAKLKAVTAATLSRSGARVIATQHFIRPAYTHRSGWKGKVDSLAHKIVNRRLAAMIAISSAVRQAMLERSEIAAGRITVIPHGIAVPDPALLTPPAQVRAEFGIDPDTRLIICASRLEREKDVTTLVSAMQQVVTAHPNAVCAIAGEGSQKADLTRQITESELKGSVRLIGFRPDVLAVIQAGDIFVLPCPVEAFGLVLLEAMAVARPVIAARAGGPLDIVVEGETGLLYAPGNAESLAQCLTSLLADPARAHALGQGGQKRMQEHFTATAMAEKTMSVYRRCLD